MRNLFADHQFRNWRAERESVRAKLSPQAYELCKTLVRVSRYSLFAAIGSVLLTGLALVWHSQSALILYVGALEVAVCITITFICRLARFMIIAMIFTRYSLQSVLVLILSINVLEMLFVLLPIYMKVVPVVFGAWLVLIVCGYVIEQDPNDGQYVPDFIRKQVIAKKFKGLKQI